MKFINLYLDFLHEGLSKDQEDYFLEDWDEDRLEDWFGKNNHRLFLPLKKKVKDGELEELVYDGEVTIETQIKNYLEASYGEQYALKDYTKGLAIDKKNKNREVRLGKLLKDKKLLQAFNDDPIRAGHKAASKDPIICLSKHPLDIAAMSTGRGWKSCKELPNPDRPEGGAHHNFLKEEVKVLLIAYLIYPDDKKIERPIARVLLLPYYNKKGQIYYNPHNKLYGSAGRLEENFLETLQTWLDEKQKDLKSSTSTFTLDAKVYDDGAATKISFGEMSPLEESIDGRWSIRPDGKIDVDGDVRISSKYKSILEVGGFGKVKGDFDCSEINLTSLEGAPEEVDNFFANDNQLSYLYDAPRIVHGVFSVSYNGDLKSLEGGPEKVDTYYATGCFLKTLEGAPRKVGSLYVEDNRLSDLTGAPDEVENEFVANSNLLTSLKGGPRKVGGDYVVRQNKLKSLEGAPEEVGGLDASDNLLTSLKGGPRKVGTGKDSIGGNYLVHKNKLIDLHGAPEFVNGDMTVDDNPDLETIDGMENTTLVGRFLYEGTKIDSIESIGKVGGKIAWWSLE